MRRIGRVSLAIVVAGVLSLGLSGGRVVHAAVPTLEVLHAGQRVALLAPGAEITVVSHVLGAPRAFYCLGLVSLRDRYGLPVSLAVFHAAGDGLMIARATVPLTVFPAEPPGPFLLFAGHCTNVAPDGNYASIPVTIEPALG